MTQPNQNPKKHSRREVTDMRQQLKNAFPNRAPENRPKALQLPSLEKWKEEGADHINIGRHSSTYLGKFLSPDFHSTFKHHIFDRFTSLLGFWTYVSMPERDDAVRTMDAQRLRRLRSNVTMRDVRHFKLIKADSMYRRVKDRAEVARAMIESTAPFDMYYLTEGVGLRIRSKNAEFYIPIYEEIRKALKENREPNWSWLGETPADRIYEAVMPKNYALDLTVQTQKPRDPKKRPQGRKIEPRKSTEGEAETPVEANAEQKTISVNATPAETEIGAMDTSAAETAAPAEAPLEEPPAPPAEAAPQESAQQADAAASAE